MLFPSNNPEFAPSSPEATEVDVLLQRDRLRSIERHFQGPWVTVRSSGKLSNAFNVFAFLIPLDGKPAFMKSVAWNFRGDDLHPQVECVTDGCDKQEVYYLRHGNTAGAEPIFHIRSHYNHWPTSLEVAEEFRLFFNLYHDSTRNLLLHCDVNGAEDEVARITATSIQIKLAYIVRYLRAKQMHLAVQFDSHASSTRSLDQLGISPAVETRCDENCHLELSVRDWDRDDEFRSVSGLMGKIVLSCPGPIEWEDPYEERRSSAINFIVGTDAAGNPVELPCKLEKGGERSADYLTPVFFKREVLLKYFNQPERFSVEDGYLHCGALWGLRLDNDHPKFITVWLGDLAHLDAHEQGHWRAFNVPPEGAFSETFRARNLMGQFADPTMADLVFKQLYPQVNEDWRKRFGWLLWKEPHVGDQYVFRKVHISVTDEQSEFDEQNVLLAKLLVDFLNEEELAKSAVGLVADAKGIAKLNGFFRAQNMTGFEVHIKTLNTLQRIRSTGIHRKGSQYEKSMTDMGLKDLHLVDASRRVFEIVVEFLRWAKSSLEGAAPKLDD